jgi:hypothetical protein
VASNIIQLPDYGEEDDTFTGPEPKKAGAVLGALKKAEREFRNWQNVCQTIDEVYGREGTYGGLRADLDNMGWRDTKLDLFWASMEILKPAVYARPPVPAVSPMFKDNKALENVTGELLERVGVSTFARTDIDDVMCQVRDDVIFDGRGVMWLTYETTDGQKVCVEHLDRMDFLHEPARYWSEVGWVARRAWLTRKEMRKRFSKTSGKAYQSAKYSLKREDESDPNQQSLTKKAGVWEVWHKADGKVYWVTDGVDVFLDEDTPHLDLSTFWPCPKPAYATLRRRSLVPVPDWERYASHFRQISDMTGRIYLLLNQVKMMGLIPAGGDVGDAIELAMDSDDDQIMIPVPGAALKGEMANFVQWLPLSELAAAISGLIEARAQLINDYYELSGISDIMRGATEANETLGAQQLKSQYGSIRVQQKIDALQKIAADAVKIASEIIAEKFTQANLLDMAQMQIPTKAELKARVKEIEDAATKELEALGKQAEQMAMQAQQSGQQVDPAAAQQQFAAAQKAIFDKYAPMLQEAEQQVPIEDVMKLLRDDRARSFTFEIETDSTILTDELQEKSSRNEFMATFMQSSQALMGLAGMGEQGATLAGEMMKFVLGPYRAGRQLDSAINAFVDAAPQMAAAAAGQEGDGEALAEANKMIAQAEMQKAEAAVATAQARAENMQIDNQRKIADLEHKKRIDELKALQDQEKLRQSAETNAMKAEELAAKIDLMRTQSLKLLTEAGVMVDEQNLNEFKSLADIDFRAEDQNMAREGQAQQQANVEADREMAATEGAPATSSPAPSPAQSAQPTTTANVMQGLNQLGEMMAQQAAALAQLTAIVSAPTELVRDEAGRPIGARKVL